MHSRYGFTLGLPILFLGSVALAACSSDDVSASDGSTGSNTTASSGTATGGAGGSSAGGGTTTSASGGGGASGGNGGAGSGGNGSGGGGGCPAAALTVGEHAATIQFDGNTREYEVQVPAGYSNSSAIPLVFDLHGYTSTANQQQLISGWQAVADANGFAVVRPDGYGTLQSWNGGDTCCGQALSQGLDDVGLMKAIVAELESQLCIDPKRIYASGLSNGGALTNRLGCDAADFFAAIAPVAYPIAYLPISKCQPSRPMAVMHSHGTLDGTVPYNGGLGIASAPASVAHWANVSGCSGDPVETYSKGTSHCDTYQGCQAGVEVTLCTINGPHLLYNNNDDVPVAQLSWDFFSKHTLP